MKGILKLVRRKIVRKRVAVLWLGLVAIELFCPALCETGTNAATPPSRSTASTSIVIDGQDELRTAISGCENDGDHEPVGDCDDECLCHAVAIPSTATEATLKFYLDVATDETTTTQAYDTLTVQVRNSSNAVLATLATYSNLNAAGGYSLKSFNLLAYKGQTVRVYFLGVEGSQVATSFVVDNVSLITK